MNLDEIRHEIDAVDSEIKSLFIKRMMLADNVARVKAETGDVIFKPDRENQIIEKLTDGVDPTIIREYTALIKRIMEISRKYQYGRTLELKDCLNIDYSSETPQIKNVAVVKDELCLYSNLSDKNVIIADSYLDVARLIKEGNADCGMGILEDIGKGVSDELHSILSDNNLYIYKCDIVNDGGIRRKAVAFTPVFYTGKNDNRLKVMFVCKNRSGSLGSILSMISDDGVNLTEIHSKPDMKSEWNYQFMVEMEACFMQKEIKALVYQLMNETEYFQILGSYSCIE